MNVFNKVKEQMKRERIYQAVIIHYKAMYGHLLLILLLLGSTAATAQSTRTDLLLNAGWYTLVSDSNTIAYDSLINTKALSPVISAKASYVNVPHTWDKYEGYRQLKHGNRHGYAWYRKEMTIGKEYAGRRLFLWFEGVSSFATVWMNGHKIGTHAGGRTSFTLDITAVAIVGEVNTITVKAEHPGFIRTLPWVCGGCSEEQGFSEGSQPLGIFRPVHLVATAPVRVEPFGVHIWNDSNITAAAASLHTTTEVKNYTAQQQAVTVVTAIIDPSGHTVHSFDRQLVLAPGQTDTVRYTTPAISQPRLWSLEDPALYKAVTKLVQGGKTTDEVNTSFGIRWVKWTLENAAGSRQLLINGKPVFLNGTAEYEHLMGNSHAFSDLEIKARAMQVRAAGFNAFRDAHQPHNLRYHPYWDSLGIAWWPQFAAHVWFDLPEFRTNFKNLLRDWIKERWNSPSIVLWGLENESTLPEDFARECSDIIREMDPTASSQRKITTCNGGTGTDWNVPQNWTGTYGGDPADYGSDLIRQVLVGEYGAWRSIDGHTEGGFDVKGPLSEDRMTQLMEMKVRLADSVKEQTAGHFHWLMYSHDNPGRVQPDEGYRYIDKVGPVNNKGLFTTWGEPTDAFYMYRSNFAAAATDPMVYIVSHTWPDRWLTAGNKPAITVYSNCDEVELFNDAGHHVSLGRKKKGGMGTHFEWNDVPVQYNVLYAEGYRNGKVVARDYILLQHLPPAPHLKQLYSRAVKTSSKGGQYLYRVNCGGPAYTDQQGQHWMADQPFTDSSTWGSRSWAAAFSGMSPVQASQRSSFELITNTNDAPLFRDFRYGREQLQYYFPVPDGEYQLELYFTEPWYGIGGGMDCTGWRVFDVAVNGVTVIKNLDIWKEAGCNKVLKKTLTVRVAGGALTLHFPSIQASQAVIAAIAIAKVGKPEQPQAVVSDLVGIFSGAPSLPAGWSVQRWLGKNDKQYANTDAAISHVPALLYGDNWIKTTLDTGNVAASFVLKKAATVYIGIDAGIRQLPLWMKGYEAVKDSMVSDAQGGTVFHLYRKPVPADSLITLGRNGKAENGTALMYTAILHYPTAFEQADKIKRPAVTYQGSVAKRKGLLLGNAAVEGYKGKLYMALQNPTDTVAWTMTVGVGDTYELRFRYRTGSNRQVPVWLTIRAADGRLMRHDKIFFAAADTKWKTLYSSTGTNINAGNYTVQLVPDSEEELFLDKLEVQ